jgi:hypothetical protein
MLMRLCRLLLLTIFLTAIAWGRDTWFQVSSPHFVVFSNGSEKQARRVGREFEQIRLVFEKAHPKLRLDSGSPVYVLAARDENTMKQLLPRVLGKARAGKTGWSFRAALGKKFRSRTSRRR